MEDTARRGRSRLPALWGWLAAVLAVLLMFAVLFDNGALLAPLVGESSYVQNYLHEFFHDARHLLGVPGH